MRFLIRRSLAVAFAAVVAWVATTSVYADINYTQGAGTVLFDFICFSTKHCPAHVSINSAGTELFTSGNPGQVGISDGTNGTVAVKPASTAAATTDKAAVVQNAYEQAALGTTGDPAWTSGAGSVIAVLKGIYAQLASIITNTASIVTNTAAAIHGNVGLTSEYPAGATAITASATGTTGATTATLAGTSGKTTYICSRSVRANATAATTVTDTLTGLVTGTISSLLWVAPAASGLGVDEEIYKPCVPASAQNTGIAIVSGAPGAGGNVTVHGTGYQL